MDGLGPTAVYILVHGRNLLSMRIQEKATNEKKTKRKRKETPVTPDVVDIADWRGATSEHAATHKLLISFPHMCRSISG